MKRVWDTLAAVGLAFVAINVIADLIRPYVPLLLLSFMAVIVGRMIYDRLTRW